MTKYQVGSGQDEDFLNKLSKYPKLRERFKEILALAGNECGAANTADEAEERAVEEVRQLGQEVLQSWTQSRHAELEKKYDARVGYRRKEKKTLLADALGNGGGDRADLSAESERQAGETV